MNNQELDQKADRLEQLLQDHKAPSKVTGGTVTPRSIQFLLQPHPGIKVAKIEALSREISIAMNVPNARITAEKGAVKISVSRNDPQPISLMRMCARLPRERIPLGTALLGLCDDGAPLMVRLPSPDVAHVLVAGTTGSGKTALVQTIVMSLALLNHRRLLQFLVIDPKGRTFESLADLPHLLRPIVTQPDQAVDALSDMVKLMETRDAHRISEPHIVIVIDELADLVQSGGPEILEHLSRLVQRGREAGLHIIAATQHPSSAALSSIVKANFPVRLVGRVTSIDDARVATGIGGTGAEKLTGRGDFIAITGPGPMRFQAAYIAPDDMAAVTQQLKRGIPGSDIIDLVKANWSPARNDPPDPRGTLQEQIRWMPPASAYGPGL